MTPHRPTAPRSLSTPRLDLRPVVPADRDHLVALEADPEVMRFLNGGRPVPASGDPDADFLTPRGTEPEVLVAHRRDTGHFIGWFALFDDGLVDGLRTAELGYRLHRAAWGQGFATEGVAALAAQALEQLGFDRVRAQTMAVNTGSRRVLDKTGFHPVGTVFPAVLRPLPGSEAGEVVYERRRPPRQGRGVDTTTA